MPLSRVGRQITITSIEEVRSLPSVGLKNLSDLPKVPGTYFVFSGELLLYIGSASVSLHQRWSRHHKRGALSAYDDVHVAYAVASDDQEACWTETHFLETTNPILNRSPKPGLISIKASKRPPPL